MDLDGIGDERSTDSGLVVLDSLFPVVELLPGLTRENVSGYYYVHGKIDPSDLESLYDYAGSIGELMLGPKPDSEPRLAPHMLVRIARLQDPNKPLFPLLHRLRILDTSSPYMNFLDLLLSSALTTLELTAIPVSDPCSSSLLSFLECAIHEATNLSTLILGPGVIQDQILDISLKYKGLRRLELLGVEISITDQLLQNIGSLRDLETFVFLDNGTSTYSHSSISTTTSDGPIGNSSLFSALQTCEVGGTFDLIGDLVAKISSTTLRVLSIDITIPLDRIPPIPQENFYPEEDVSFRTEGFPFNSHFPSKKKKKKGCLSEPSPEILYPAEDAPFGWFSNSSLRPPSPPPRPPSPPRISTADIMALLRSSIQKWPNTLVSVSFKNDSTVSFSLPPDIFEDLLLRRNMKYLEITGMGIDSVDGALHRLKEVEHSRLEGLHIPVHFSDTAVSRARLRDIAEACPYLKSLRCRLSIPDPSDIIPSSPLSHQLETLSVSNGGQLQQNQFLGIARFLDSIFPNLKSITTHDGNNTEQWSFISDLVKSYQAVRTEDHQRLGLSVKA